MASQKIGLTLEEIYKKIGKDKPKKEDSKPKGKKSE